MTTCGHCDYLSTISNPADMSAEKRKEGIGRCRADRYGRWLHFSTPGCERFTVAENAGARVKWMAQVQHNQEES
jgi:hypothetical protein